MTFLHTALAFLLALGPLIVFHELGHYWVARLCGVKVLRFSIGMGKVVWSRRVGPDRTEWSSESRSRSERQASFSSPPAIPASRRSCSACR